MDSVRMHIGVDVGMDSLDICYPNGDKKHVKNNKSWRTSLIKKALRLEAIVCFEATGPYEEALAEECLAAGVRAVRLDAWRTRKYAESRGRIEKTDRIDCEMIRDYAASLPEDELRFVKPLTQERKRLRDSVSARRNLLKTRNLIANVLESPVIDREIAKTLKGLVEKIEKTVGELEKIADEAIAADGRMANLARRFQEVKGVGPVLTRTVLASCPDIGEFNDKSIAKMVGNAPIDCESCTIKKPSRVRRGRDDLKQAFFMAAVSASRTNHILSKTYQGLIQRGKPRKVALTAVARHLAVLLNLIAKYDNFKLASDPKDEERAKAAAEAAKTKRPRGRPRKAS